MIAFHALENNLSCMKGVDVSLEVSTVFVTIAADKLVWVLRRFLLKVLLDGFLHCSRIFGGGNNDGGAFVVSKLCTLTRCALRFADPSTFKLTFLAFV